MALRASGARPRSDARWAWPRRALDSGLATASVSWVSWFHLSMGLQGLKNVTPTFKVTTLAPIKGSGESQSPVPTPGAATQLALSLNSTLGPQPHRPRD